MMQNNFTNSKGMTLIEVMVSFVILGFISSVLGLWFIANNNTLVNADAKSKATLVAQRVMDSLQVRGIGAIPTDTTTFNCTQPNQIAMTCTTIVTIADQIAANSTTNYAIAKKVHIGVMWKVGSFTKNTSMEGIIQ